MSDCKSSRIHSLLQKIPCKFDRLYFNVNAALIYFKSTILEFRAKTVQIHQHCKKSVQKRDFNFHQKILGVDCSACVGGFIAKLKQES